jgi:hypothetical protein
MRLKIGVALLLIAIALASKTIMGFCISFLASVLIQIQYALWYLDTQRWLRELGLIDFSQLKDPALVPHFAGIYQALPMDFAIFLFTTAVLIWQVRVIAVLYARRGPTEAGPSSEESTPDTLTL